MRKIKKIDLIFKNTCEKTLKTGKMDIKFKNYM